jgi:hypothetical protein
VEELNVSGSSARYDALTTGGYNYSDASDSEGSSTCSGDAALDDPDGDSQDPTSPLPVASHPVPASLVLAIPLMYSVSVLDGTDENSPDPFRIPSSSSAPLAYSSTHAWAPIRILYLMAICQGT